MMGLKIRRLAAAILSAVLLYSTLPVQALAPGRATAVASQVTVRFHSSGSGSEAPSPITIEQGGQLALPQAWLDSPLGIRDWHFAGWSERVSASAPDYLPGETFYLTRDMDLYAVFTRIPPASPERAPSQGTAAFTVRVDSHTKYMSGEGDGLFYPAQPLTRAGMAQILYNIVVERPAREAGFSDVSSGSWFAPAVGAMAGLGILPGYNDGTFRPKQPITRVEAARALAQLIPAGGPTKAFRDVPSDSPDYEAISAVGGYGLFSGDENGSFNPNASFLRAEAAVVFNKLLGRSPDLGAVYAKTLRYFPDVPTDHWAYTQVMEAATSHSHTPSGGGEIWSNIQTEPVPLADGYYRLNGRLYCVSNGQFLRSASQEGFYFDHEGRYTTGDNELDLNLNALVDQLTTPSMTRDQKLRALYNYCRDNFSYLKRPLVEAGRTGWEPEYAASFLSLKKGNCYSFSALFSLLAREIGQPAYTVVGGLGKNASPHGWVEIKLDGTVYMFDPQLEWRYVHDYGRKSHNLFKFLPAKSPHLYTKLSGGAP